MGWEYRRSANLHVSEMNTFGKDGWELVSVVQTQKDGLVMFWKRAL